MRDELIAAVADARNSPTDLGNRLQSKEAQETRKASIRTRAMLEAQWIEK